MGFVLNAAEGQSLIQLNPANATYVLPYLGGDDITSDPALTASRWTIYFGELPLSDAERFPDLMSIVRARVLPERLKQKDKRLREKWWLYKRPTLPLYASLRAISRVLVNNFTSKYGAFVFVPTAQIFSNALNTFALDDYGSFAVLQSTMHQVWFLKYGSSLETRPRYTPTTCFETFPLPENWRSIMALEAAGRAYYEHRARVMGQMKSGITDIYNRFHDPDECSPDIVALREMHSVMDRAVLDAYQWTDVSAESKFVLEARESLVDRVDSETIGVNYEIDGGESVESKKGYRYRWPDDVRNEVLARLLKLNAERGREEARSGVTKTKNPRTASQAGELLS